MDATRRRFRFEDDDLDDLTTRLRPVVIAAGVLLLLVVVAVVIRELRFAPRALATAVVTSSMPSEVVSVTTLVLTDDRQIHVGDAKPDTIARLGSQRPVKRTEEPARFGLREIDTYPGFTVVFEPFQRSSAQRV